MKRSSSTSESRPGGLFDGVEARGAVPAAVGDDAWLAALLTVEAALARAEAKVGLIAPATATAIAAACRPERFDLAALGAAAPASGNPVVPLVAALRSAVGPPAAEAVHLGATSQDILDTAAMLVCRSALDAILADLDAAAEAAAGLARAHRDTLMAGRTLLQQAAPTTFGLEAAGWLSGLDAAAAGLRRVRDERLAVQFGGAVGTLAAVDAAGADVGADDGADLGLAARAALAAELGLHDAPLAWHTERTRIGELAGALATASGAIAGSALDVVLLAQTEVGEVREGGAEATGRPARGGSSTLPQKHNPIAAVAALACARQAPGLAATLFSAMAQEHQRAAGAWHAEWRPLRELCIAVGSAAAWLRDCLERLIVDPERMARNAGLTGGAVLSERVVIGLTPVLGRASASALVGEALAASARSGRPFAELVAELVADKAAATPTAFAAADVGARVDPAAWLDPSGYLGSARRLVDAALAAHQGRRER